VYNVWAQSRYQSAAFISGSNLLDSSFGGFNGSKDKSLRSLISLDSFFIEVVVLSPVFWPVFFSGSLLFSVPESPGAIDGGSAPLPGDNSCPPAVHVHLDRNHNNPVSMSQGLCE
jgi:hypothetical protein